MKEPKDTQDTSKEFERLREEIKRLSEEIDKSYYSIPKKEFENVTVRNITQEVTGQMNKRISSWRNWIGLIVLILSFFGITQGGKFITGFRDEIRNDIKSINEKIEKEFKSIDDDIGEKFKSMTKSFDLLIESKIETKINERLQFIRGAQQRLRDDQERIKKDLNEDQQKLKNTIDRIGKSVQSAENAAKSVDLRNKFNVLKTDVNKRITNAEAASKIKPFIKDAIKLEDKILVNEMLAALFRWKFLAGKYEELDKLRVQYEKDFDFFPETWANIAIADMNLYEESNAPIYKQRAISAYEKSLEALPDYGVPHAVRLMIHMIDYEREKDPKTKEIEKSEAMKLINTINSGRVLVTSYETYNYLLDLKQGDVFGGYINKLFKIFPEPMELMAKRYKLEDAIKKGDKTLINKTLAALFRWKFLAGKYEELDKLRVQYEKDFDFFPETWANIAIADMNLYEESNAPIYKQRAISAYEKSLEALPDYGVPHAVRLMIHMIDYEREKDPKTKEIEKSEAMKLINTINSGRVLVTSYETYNYLLDLKQGDVFGGYINKLFKIFPEPMELMAKRYNEYKTRTLQPIQPPK